MKIALVGNPNSGKSSLFNQLTGLHQKIGNFAGVTVDKKTGICKISPTQAVEILDLPGAYSLYPRSLDESIVAEVLLNPYSTDKPDAVIVVADASNLKRNLLLFTQVHDLGIPTLLVLNMLDIAQEKGIYIDTDKLAQALDTQVVSVNARTGEGIDSLKRTLHQWVKEKPQNRNEITPIINSYFLAPEVVKNIKQKFQLSQDYIAFLYANQYESLQFITPEAKELIESINQQYRLDTLKSQARETLARYEILEDILQTCIKKEPLSRPKGSLYITEKLDVIFTHKIYGYLSFFAILFLIFQAIFTWATYPMNLIDSFFGFLQTWLKDNLPKGIFTDLLAEGIMAGLGGIFVFIPQIAILFGFIAILEETGYMARVAFIMDKPMRKFGLNGKSIIPLVSGVACAIPAIMATRTIDNWRERLLTIFVVPLMSCSARIPVYVILIALVIPNTYLFGFIHLQALALMGLYVLGFIFALASAFLLKTFIRTNESSYLILELPSYKLPHWANVGYTIKEKVQTFVWEAGKIILAISILLWALASNAPQGAMERAEKEIKEKYKALSKKELDNKIAARKLEVSYIGILGKSIEPIIAPLGYDWKIGIALLTSFAAREVFVATISTIYSIGTESEDLDTIQKRLRAEINPKTQKPFFTPAVGFSLMVFYAFALQCMSTVGVVYRETKGWKWTLVQLFYLTTLAYCTSFVVFQLLK
ncbi:MAG: ferrous iron transport protein B [Microscillaceae bacterium]|nr:ferrous iron transport protein B [Microscillaceae bacterium]MDW8461906.1 ferrous iron transport protein B [Cytophagales bacterium]